MTGYYTFYDDTKYKDSYANESPLGFSYGKSFPTSHFALTTRPDTANQIKEVTEKLSTGAKAIEVTGISPKILEAVPEQHLEEIRRLAKLSGTELTLHGPLVEPSGAVEQRWDELQRRAAEKTMISAIERGHKLNPDGNIIVTFHSSNGLLDPETKVKTDKGEEVSLSTAVINEREGRVYLIPIQKESYYTKEKPTPEKEIARINEQQWEGHLSTINNEMSRGKERLNVALQRGAEILHDDGGKNALLKAYNLSQMDSEKYEKYLRDIAEKNSLIARQLKENVDHLSHAHIFIRDAYSNFKEAFNQAFEAAVKTGNKERENELKKFRDNFSGLSEEYRQDRTKVIELAETVDNGLKLLSKPGNAPEIFRPLKEFAIEQSAKTFSNVAFHAYEKFGNSAPIISIENPPVGMGITRAADIKEMIAKTRDAFVERAKKEGIGEYEARKQADKLIGATWDVGHINMLRRYGYSEKDILEETKKIAPDVKHIHLSDNFGLEHTELPMGMGNVPTKQHMELIEQYSKKAGELKKVIETGDWYQHFQVSPFAETLHAFGAQVYGKAVQQPYWSNIIGSTGGYFAGYGLNPDVHHSIYGGGFSSLPVELGGQIQGRSRLSGTPIE